MNTWLADRPIYLQVQDQILDRVLDGSLAEGDAVPSVREAAAALQVNPLTVNRACQGLVDEGVLDKRRGVGLFVAPGARAALKARMRERFLQDEWPGIQARAARLDLTLHLTPSQDVRHD